MLTNELHPNNVQVLDQFCDPLIPERAATQTRAARRVVGARYGKQERH